MIGLGAVLAALVAAAAPSAPPDAASAAPKNYVSDFCTPIAFGDADPGSLRRLYAYWDARIATDAQAEAFNPQDAGLNGQMVTLPGEGAPHAFIDRRRGSCALVYAGAAAPAAVLDELRTVPIPIGPKGSAPTAWRRINTKRVGRPGPIRYFLPASDQAGFGLCATLFEDLRLRDDSPATVVRVETCRLPSDETFDNG